VVSNGAGKTQLIKMSELKGLVTTTQLKSGSYLGRLWGSLAGWGSAGGGREVETRGSSSGGATVSGSTSRSDHLAPDGPISFIIHPLNGDLFVVALCRDNKIRMWSSGKLKVHIRAIATFPSFL